MYRFFFIAPLLFALSSLQAEPRFNVRNANSVVKINVHSGSGKIYFGSGVIVGPREVVTNCHVTRNAESIDVSKSAYRYRAVSQRVDMVHDLCLLQTSTKLDLPAATPRKSADSLRLGEPVTVYGYPGGVSITFFNGTVEALHRYDQGHIIETTASIGLGNSGGGLFDDQGRLAGIATFVPAKYSGLFYAVPVNWIELLRARPAQQIGELEGLTFWELAPEQQPFFLKTTLHAGQGEWNAMERDARRWTEAEANNPEAWYALGQALHRLGRTRQAVHVLERTLSLEEKHDGAWYLLGRIYAERGDEPNLARIKKTLTRLNHTLAARLNDNIR